ncbi:hypothetical protein ABPG75_004345 [Micractinium tetrahymenae]
MLQDGWPAGIEALTGLTLLHLSEEIYNDPQDNEPPNLSALTKLQHLHICGGYGTFNFRMPDLRLLASSLRCLRCQSIEAAPLLRALPVLTGLSALLLVQRSLAATTDETE